MKKGNWKLRLGIVLMIVSVPFFLVLVIIPFGDFENKTKVTLSTISLVSGEILFWGGGLLVGKEIFAKYKRYFNPKNWLSSKKKSNKDASLD